MIFTKTDLSGAYIIDIERKEDPRGFFARVSCVDEFAAHGFSFQPVQASIAWNTRRATVRGLHYQAPPHAEAKIVRCTAGAVYDVLLDMRKVSPTYGRWIGVELSAASRRSLFVPEGIAHGYQTLVNDTEVYYQMTTRYHPEAARGVRWDDPMLAIDWPLPAIAIVSDADRARPTFAAATAD